MNIEKELRYKVNDEIVKRIRSNTRSVNPEQEMIDLVMGYHGFNSLNQLGYICRIRLRNQKTLLECKKLNYDSTWTEETITLENIQQGYNFLSLMGYQPYLLIDRMREERETDDFKIAIDNVALLGTFVEFEIKNLNDKNIRDKLRKFILEWKITDEPQKLYGDIFKEKCENDIQFKVKFDEMLKKIVSPLYSR